MRHAKAALLLFLLASAFFQGPVVAQSLDRAWTRTFDGGEEDQATDIGVTSDGDVYVAGLAHVQTTKDVAVLKYGRDGTPLWSVAFGGAAHAPILAVDPLDRAIVADYLSLGLSWGGAVATVAYGDTVWTRTLYPPVSWRTWPKAIEVQGAEIYIAADYDEGPWLSQIHVFPLDGGLGCSNILSTTYSHELHDLCVQSDRILMTGSQRHGMGIPLEIVDPQSCDFSQVLYLGEGSGISVLSDRYDDYAVVGNTQNGGSVDVWVAVYRSYGEPYYYRTIDVGGADDRAVAAASGQLALFDALFVVGTTLGASADVLVSGPGWGWTVTYDGPTGGDDDGVDIGVLPTGEIVVLARVAGVTGSDQALLLYSAEDGQLLDVDIDPAVDDPVGLAITTDGVIYTTGNTAAGDIIVNKYEVSATGIQPSSAPTTLRIGPPEPNPSSGAVAIPYELPGDTDVRAGVYDISGRLVRMLTSGRQTSGAHRLEWDGLTQNGGAVASGVYFVRIDQGDRVERRQVVIAR